MTMTIQRKKRTSEDRLARGALFTLLARGFSYPEPGCRAAFLRDLAKVTAARREPSLEPVRRAWINADEAALAAEYGRLFMRNTPCPLHETAYGDARRMAGRAAELADINGFYAAFGLKLSESDPDLPDHLATELEFYGLLLVKQAYAQCRRRAADLRVTERAAQRFMEQHLGRWGVALAGALAVNGAAAPFRTLVAAVQAAIGAECKALRFRPAVIAGRTPFDGMQAETLTCPLAAA
jgi:TorA maturation chaperone TorD